MTLAVNLINAAMVPGGLAPTGALLAFAGATAPAGWLLCDGSNISRSTYASLFGVLGTSYGAGDGSTTFALPDLRGRLPAGKDDMGGSSAGRLSVSLTGTKAATTSGVITGLSSTAALAVGMTAIGAGIGTNAVINSIDSATQVTLSVNSTATGAGTIRFGVVDGITLGAVGGAHTHTLTTPQMPAHTHTFTAVISTGSGGTGGGSSTASASTTASTGGGQSHPNMQPTIITNYIIKV